MQDPHRKKPQRNFRVVGIAVTVVIVFVGTSVGVLSILINDDGSKRRRQIQMVTLMKPPQPPKIKEKPPEPEVEKKEEIVEPEPEETPPEEMEDQSDSDVPEGKDLGLDAEGTAGSDAFGLRGKKGGRALIGGGGNSLLKKYAWYTQIIKDEIHKMLMANLEDSGGIPKGSHNAILELELDDLGRIASYQILRSSGNKRLDATLESVLEIAKISEPPPIGMPRTLKLKLTGKG